MEAVASYPAARTKTSLPGNFAIWIFICAELLVFGIFFWLTRLPVRSTSSRSTPASRPLIGKAVPLINTLVLITPGYFMAMAVSAKRRNAARRCSQWLLPAILSGVMLV